jgi:hypothetical protein
MATVTAGIILSDIYSLLASSTLKAAVNGSVYYDGVRARNSTLEDIVIIYTAGLTDQIQEGTVSINVYVPDVDIDIAGTKAPNLGRLFAIAAAAQTWVNSLRGTNSPYRFALRQAIAHYKVDDEAFKQHYVHIRLGYSLLSK